MEWDGYEGWIDQNQVYKTSKESFDKITNAHVMVSTDLVNYITTQDNLLFPILIGSYLRAMKTLQHQFEVESHRPEKNKKILTSTAYLFLNAPYLWGGRTLMGIDCSGFTQMVYKINGIKLSRDAHQQALQGQTLSFIEESEAGDLAFFDDEEGNIKREAPKKDAPKEDAPKEDEPKKTFKQAFAKARKDGDKTFMFNGKKYTTELKSMRLRPLPAPTRLTWTTLSTGFSCTTARPRRSPMC